MQGPGEQKQRPRLDRADHMWVWMGTGYVSTETGLSWSVFCESVKMVCWLVVWLACFMVKQIMMCVVTVGARECWDMDVVIRSRHNGREQV